ncbi:TPA: hypothetical protein ACVO0R_004286 [Vibrio alginolyticus]|uniref:hypothetical protein n=1 Tax=Vibrio diabolicus TaxID=50719 RepID=UPI0012494231|nr:hypothetical protein [Vibrio diabolicus]KAB0316738.1 hypothetical protein F6W79_16975 [Vibrio diabolicus]NVC52087.1 hypothetical protein [Vibrio diabolicus]
MKKLILLICFSLISSSVFADSHSGKVSNINLYGENWKNGHRGEILFRLENMPSNARLFRIRKSDIAFNTFLSTLLSAKHTKSNITVHYDIDDSANKYAPVLAIILD